MKASRIHNRRGVALILTLAILAIVLILLMAFITSMRTERIAAKSYTDYVKAKLLADAAVDEAVALLRAGTPLQTNGPPPLYNQPTTFWTAPGLALTNYNGQFGTVELYSIRDPFDVNPEAFANLNTNSLITGSNTVISATTNGIYANWINVGANGATPTANNPIVGRFAYWVDDEATKVNINSAWARDPTTGTQTNNSLLSEVTLDALQPPFNNPALSDAVKNERSPHPFNTPNEVRRSGNAALINADAYTSNQFYLTTYSLDTNVDTWGRARIDLNSIIDPTPAGDAYQRMNEDIYKSIYPFWNTSSNTFVKKYGSVNVQQILANIIDYTQGRDANALYDSLDAPAYNATLGVPQTYCGLKKGPYLNEVIFHAMQTNAVTSIDTISGTPDIYITNWNVFVRIFVDAEVINPFPDALGAGWELLVRPVSMSYDVGLGQLGAANNSAATWTNWYPSGTGTTTVNLPSGAMTNFTMILPEDVPAYQYRGFSQPRTVVSVLNDWKGVPKWEDSSQTLAGDGTTANQVPLVTNIRIQMGRVLLRRNPGDASSIRDWATDVGPLGGPSDLPLATVSQALLFWAQSALIFNQPIHDWLTIQQGINPNFDKESVGFAKNDPRMRTFANMTPVPAWTNWVPTSGTTTKRATPVAANSADVFDHKTQAFAPFMPDGAEAGTSQQNVEPSTFLIKESAFESPGEMGFIHVGYPWRTLRMQSVVPPTNSVVASCSSCTPKVLLDPLAEATRIPDWLLLDIFTAGATPAMTGRININATMFGSNDFPRPTVLKPNVLHPRNPSLAALFYGMDTVPLSLVNNTAPITISNWWGRYAIPAGFAPSVGWPQPSSIDVRANTNAMFVAWAHDTNVATSVHSTFFSTNAAAVSTYYYDTNSLFLTPGEILEVTGIDNALVQYSGNGPRKADKELIPRKIANLITTRSNAFTIWTTAQAIKDINTNGVYEANIDLVTGEVKVQAVVERYVDTTTIPPTVKFRTKYYRYIYE